MRIIINTAMNRLIKSNMKIDAHDEATNDAQWADWWKKAGNSIQ